MILGVGAVGVNEWASGLGGESGLMGCRERVGYWIGGREWTSWLKGESGLLGWGKRVD